MTFSHTNVKETQEQIILALHSVLVSSIVIKTLGEKKNQGGKDSCWLPVPACYSSSWWGKALQQKHEAVQSREDRQLAQAAQVI